MDIDTVCRGLIDAFRSRPTIRAGSLITTVFGDAIAPRGGTLWLGSLIAILEDFGVSERLVRTSVYRLANDGWLESEQVGRKSYYSLTADGRARFAAATHRIYATRSGDWDGYWCLLLLPALNAVTRDLVKKECGWLGFGAMSTNVLAHPGPDADDLEATLKRLGVAGEIVVMTGHTVASDAAMRRLAGEAWNLAELDARYARLVERFEPALETLAHDGAVTPKTAFLLRTLLIQEYRKILLRDPQMPTELLPPKWHGKAAYRLCRDLYRKLHARADEYLGTTVETRDGALPEPDAGYYSRFGGLDSGEHG